MVIYIFLGLIVLMIALYFYCICPRFSMREELKPYLHTQFAHRGYHCAERLIPENSMPAFEAAVTHGYGIELDLHLTKDKKLVVFHDDSLDRMCGISGTIEAHTYEELLQFHLLNTTERIPLFTDLLDYVDGRVPLLIELKIPTSSLEVCEKTYRTLEVYNGPYMVQSFNTMGLRWFKKHAPHVLRGQLASNLTAKKSKEHILLRFSVKHLLANVLGRPDFISYKLSDLPTLGVFICQRIFKIPIAVWTLRTERALKQGLRNYDFQIFEKSGNLY